MKDAPFGNTEEGARLRAALSAAFEVPERFLFPDDTSSNLEPHMLGQPPSPLPKADPNLSWEAQRKIWNAEGKCSREACQGNLIQREEGRHPKFIGKHRHSGLLYCPNCTILINDPNPEVENLVEKIPPMKPKETAS